MSETEGKPPVWFWVIAGGSLLWNLFGVVSYIGLVTISPEKLAEMPAAERDLVEKIPVWATSAFAIAVFSAVGGSLMLLLKKSLAQPLFVVSLVAMIVQFASWLFVSGALSVHGAGSLLMPAMVIGVAVLLIWFTASAKSKGWIS
ncbi:MAG: hypothetical protein AAGD92_15895 [Pseudomonadota bacterium]